MCILLKLDCTKFGVFQKSSKKGLWRGGGGGGGESGGLLCLCEGSVKRRIHTKNQVGLR